MKQSISILLFAAALLAGCGASPNKSADVSSIVRKTLDQAGLKDVSVSQDRDKGIVTLGGHVGSESEKMQAESLTKPLAQGQVVAMEIAVVPPGAESVAKAINKDLDKGIESNVDAALRLARLYDSVKYEVKNAVVTLNGDVPSQAIRATAEDVVARVPNVKQVVNTLQVKGQKATSTN